MSCISEPIKRLYFETPLIESLPMSRQVGSQIFLKMENTHPAGSFKMRGVSHLCQEAVSKGYSILISSSGGSAGLAVAFSARLLEVKCHVVVPRSTSETVKKKLVEVGATIEVHGAFWNQSNERALELAKQPGCFYIHPFDHPTVWEGNSTMITEVKKSDAFRDLKPSLVVASVGGGGLACGVILGMKKVGWGDVPLLALETIGADCFNQSIVAGKKITLDGINSVALGLGSTCVCDKMMEYVNEHRIISKVVTDDQAVSACFRFADDHRVMVDASCGATLAAAYSGIIKDLKESGEVSEGPVLVIACGGTHITLDIFAEWKNKFQI